MREFLFVLFITSLISFRVVAHPEIAPMDPPLTEREIASELIQEIPDVEIDTDTPIKLEEIAGDVDLTASRPWRAPDYSAQESSLGYSEDAFKIPKGLEAAVAFWKDIYSKYSTDQGVLHDADNIDLIYEVIDFSDISRRSDLNIFQKERRKLQRVKEAKRKVIAKIRAFKGKNPELLSASDRTIFDRLSAEKGRNPFEAAIKKNRLRFQLGQKDRIIQGIYFSGRYLEDFEKIFKEAGLPVELTRMVFVESSFNIMARSKVGASGLWQIMPYTTKGFFKRSDAYDLRNHPIEATKLAAKLLRNNYRMLESWPLAVTGYNHGPYGIKKLTQKYKTRELGELVANADGKRRFGFASTNFYASFLAVLEVEKNAPQYLGPVLWSQKLPATEIKSNLSLTYSDLERWFGDKKKAIEVFNPHLSYAVRKGRINIPKGTSLYVPSSQFESIQREISSYKNLKEARKGYREAQGRD